MKTLWLATDVAPKLYEDLRKKEQAVFRAKIKGEKVDFFPVCDNPAWLRSLYNRMLFAVAPIGPPGKCEVRFADLREDDNPDAFNVALYRESVSGDPKIDRLLDGFADAINREMQSQNEITPITIQQLHALVWSRPLNGNMEIKTRNEDNENSDKETFFNIQDLVDSGIITALEKRIKYRDRFQPDSFADYLLLKQREGLITVGEFFEYYDEYTHHKCRK